MIIYFWIGACTGFFVSTLLFIIYISKYTISKSKYFSDEVTGLKNAYYFNEYFNQFLTLGNSYALIDIDSFTKFNDMLGYERADEILRLFALKISSMLPEGGDLIRYKFGDEFLIILRGSDSADTLQFINQLHSLFSKTANQIPLVSPIDFSGGITSFIQGDSKKAILDRLNHALMAAKRIKGTSIVI